jgi:hypothetical protein
VRDALILPVVFTAAAWAVDRFTRSALGDWRYVFVAILGLCAVYTVALAAVIAVALHAERRVDRPPRWSERTTNSLIVVLATASTVVEVVRAARDHSAVGVFTAPAVFAWICCSLVLRSASTLSRGRRRVLGAIGVIVPLWIIAVAVFHLY